ncbi:uncharacterized protein [Triticum aestivum]|uniref:uncharacterized protein isoform X1 n=1 Tax=Triticum aestivum TaxID=4565 RepID=UPI001D012677|nr:uncharacterized protein LOC123082955 isoform X1 [Triticum aestivum]
MPTPPAVSSSPRGPSSALHPTAGALSLSFISLRSKWGGSRPCTQIERGGRVTPAAAGSKAQPVGSCSGSSQGPRRRDPQPRRVRTLAAAVGHRHDPRTSDGHRHQGSLYAGLHQRQLHHQDLQPPPPAFICIRAACRLPPRGSWASTSPGNCGFFNPEFYRIVLFDQRGTGRALPMLVYRRTPPRTWRLTLRRCSLSCLRTSRSSFHHLRPPQDVGLHSSKVGCTGALGRRIPKKNHTQQCVFSSLEIVMCEASYVYI